MGGPKSQVRRRENRIYTRLWKQALYVDNFYTNRFILLYDFIVIQIINHLQKYVKDIEHVCVGGGTPGDIEEDGT